MRQQPEKETDVHSDQIALDAIQHIIQGIEMSLSPNSVLLHLK